MYSRVSVHCDITDGHGCTCNKAHFWPQQTCNFQFQSVKFVLSHVIIWSTRVRVRVPYSVVLCRKNTKSIGFTNVLWGRKCFKYIFLDIKDTPNAFCRVTLNVNFCLFFRKTSQGTFKYSLKMCSLQAQARQGYLLRLLKKYLPHSHRGHYTTVFTMWLLKSSPLSSVASTSIKLKFVCRVYLKCKKTMLMASLESNFNQSPSILLLPPPAVALLLRQLCALSRLMHGGS